MWVFRQSFHLTSRQRRIILGVVMILACTSTRVQAAELGSSAPSVNSVGMTEEPVSSLPLPGLTVPSETVVTSLPRASDLQPAHELRVSMTAYSSTPEETDASPFITADGSHVRDGIVAANFLRFGTKVKIPELFGDKVFEVHDRMNSRFPNRMDIWMGSGQEARVFGIHHNVKLEIF